jgi:hypothetical protein
MLTFYNYFWLNLNTTECLTLKFNALLEHVISTINKTRSFKSRSDISLYFRYSPDNCARHILRVIFCSFLLISTGFTCLCFCKKAIHTCNKLPYTKLFVPKQKGHSVRGERDRICWIISCLLLLLRFPALLLRCRTSLIVRITGHRKSVYYAHTESELPKTAVSLGDIVRSPL